MKKIRLIVTIATIALFIAAIAGITILITNQRLNFLDTTYEIIAFCVGIAGMLLSVVSQIDSYRQERIIAQLKTELNEINHESDLQLRTERSIKRQLEQIEQEITKPPRRK